MTPGTWTPTGPIALARMLDRMAGIQRELAEGACAEVDPELFFPESGQNSAAVAKRICHGCDVRTQCLAGALERREAHGIWGGLTTRERDRLRTVA